MSGILSAIEAAGQMFGGYGLVTLGPVQFQGMEVPENVPVGGQQALAVFKLPGGERVIHAMGRDDDPMKWTGYLSGSNAESRMQTLDALRQSGSVITLAFGQSSYQVVVQSFTASYERQNWIPYSISVVVLADNAAKFGASSPSLLDDLNADLSGALGFNVGAAASAALQTAQTAVNVAGALGLNNSAWTSAISDLTVAQTAIVTANNASMGSIGAVTAAAQTAGNILGVSQISNVAGALSGLVGNTQAAAQATQALGYVGRSIKNLSNASA